MNARTLTKQGVLCALALSLLVITGGPVVAATKAQAPRPAAATWKLVDYQQKACFSPSVKTSSYGIWIKGTWKRAINVGIKNLPSAGSYTTSYAPIPPGSSTGVYSLAYVNLTLNNPPNGTYTAKLWAADGTTGQAVPVTVTVQDRCGHY
jgi:hypothetical protein